MTKKKPRGKNRLQPRQELVDLKHRFSQKNSIIDFRDLHRKLYEEMSAYSNKEKLKGGEYQTMISEISALSRMIDKYEPSHIQYTGGPGSSGDGVLYFNDKKQPVEIVSMVNEQEMQAFSVSGGFSLVAPPSLVGVMQGLNWSEEQAREYLQSQIDSFIQPDESIKKQAEKGVVAPQGRPDIPEDFIYKKIISALNKKNKPVYKDFWLLISYAPFFLLSCFGKEEVRSFILNKIQLTEKSLLRSIKTVFKKVIFVPFDKGQEDHQIFEWSLNT